MDHIDQVVAATAADLATVGAFLQQQRCRFSLKFAGGAYKNWQKLIRKISTINQSNGSFIVHTAHSILGFFASFSESSFFNTRRFFPRGIVKVC